MKDYVTPEERKNLIISKVKVINKSEIEKDIYDYHKNNLIIKNYLNEISNLVNEFEHIYNLDPELYKRISKLLFSKDQLFEKLFELALLYQKQSLVGDFLFKKYSKLYIDSVQGRF